VIGGSIALAWFENLYNGWIDPGLVTAFILGAGVASATALVLTLMGMDGSRSYREGLDSESWTAKALNGLRNQGWHVFHDLEFQGWNIDHVLIGPEGVIAIETKLRNEEWTITGTSLEDSRHRPVRWIGNFVTQASRQARTLRSLLRAGGVRTDVLAVLVLWGRDITGLPTVNIDGVLIGLGNDINEWIEDIRSTPLASEQVLLARQAVERFKAGKGVSRRHLTAVATEPDTTARQ